MVMRVRANIKVYLPCSRTSIITSAKTLRFLLALSFIITYVKKKNKKITSPFSFY